MILNSGSKSLVDDEDGKADVEDEPDLPVGVAIKRLRKVFEVHACMLFLYLMPPVRESGFRNRGKSGILGFGIRNTAQGIRNPINDWNPISKNPESKDILDSLPLHTFSYFRMKNEKVVLVVAQGLLCTRLLAVSLLSSNLVRGVHVCGHFSLLPVSKKRDSS